MKIKCPACAQVLNIPDSAAGKVVKCPCGKQLRAPAPAGTTPPAKPAQPTASGPAPQRPAPQRPAPQPASDGFDPDLFDELTDKDLQPVSAVPQPGRATGNPYAPTSPSSNKMLNQYASGDVRDSGEGTAKGPRPGLLTFLGIANILWALLYFGLALVLMGLLTVLQAVDEEVPDVEGAGIALIGGAMVLMGALSVATTVACFVNKPFCWYIMLFSYSYGFMDRVFGVVGKVMDGEPPARIGGAVFGIIIGLSFWAFMHGEEVRSYYGTQRAPMGGLVIANVLGILVGGGLSAAVIFAV